MAVFQFGHAGVDLFFVISGFIITFIHYEDIGHPQGLRRYLGRRFSRIMPTYWVALALTIILSLGGGHGFPSFLETAWSAALLPAHEEPLLGVAWTLRYEIVFYGVFSVLILNRIVGLGVLSIWCFWIVMAKFRTDITFNLPESLYGFYNLEFFLGMLVAHRLKNHASSRPRLWLMAGTALFVAAAIAEDAQLMDGYADIGRLIYGSAAALIVLGAAESSRRSLIVTPKILRSLGTASYSIYLFQFVFIGIAWKIWMAKGIDREVPHIASFPLLVVIGVAGGIAMSRLVEYPLMGLVRRFSPAHPSYVGHRVTANLKRVLPSTW